MPRLRRSDCSAPGIKRVKKGRGFAFYDESGEKIGDKETVERIRELAVPPAWKEVWVCSDPWGHIQATGFDVAGRKQYRYHQKWREREDRKKFDEMLEFAESVPKLRKRVEKHLEDSDALDRERVLACAVRLLDTGFFRIGTEEYAEANESYGLATILKDHVTLGDGPEVVFDYPAKSGRQMKREMLDPEVRAVIEPLKRRRGGSEELLAWKEGRRWRDVKSGDINAYLKEVTGDDFSAKDFRTWNATVLAAVALAVSGQAHGTKTGRKRAIARAVKEVAGYLGNTPAVCRASYIDPRVIDRFEDGIVITTDLEPEDAGEAVLDLLREEDSPDVENVA
ncbi:MAG: DNA topoisomerase IB [Thermoleophilaceae bacterium]|nr:DNA topoisomerase IB [Thermoleophilaceae bacterium]